MKNFVDTFFHPYNPWNHKETWIRKGLLLKVAEKGNKMKKKKKLDKKFLGLK